MASRSPGSSRLTISWTLGGSPSAPRRARSASAGRTKPLVDRPALVGCDQSCVVQPARSSSSTTASEIAVPRPPRRRSTSTKIAPTPASAPFAVATPVPTTLPSSSATSGCTVGWSTAHRKNGDRRPSRRRESPASRPGCRRQHRPDAGRGGQAGHGPRYRTGGRSRLRTPTQDRPNTACAAAYDPREPDRASSAIPHLCPPVTPAKTPSAISATSRVVERRPGVGDNAILPNTTEPSAGAS